MDEQLQQILQQQMRDVHLPDAVSWWPLSTAWWLLIILLLCVLSYFSLRVIQKHRRNLYRKIASRELQSYYDVWRADKDAASYIQGANELLKRCVISFSPMAAKLSGQAWTNILELHSTKPLSEKTTLALTESVYQAQPNVDVSALNQELSQWIRQHKQEVSDV